MRVITGLARGARLVTPEGDEARPTSERVKEAIFSAIQFEIDGRTVLDLFAGSGQLGIEALSRGAHRCDFVDSSPAAIEMVQKNLAKCRMEQQAATHQTGYEGFLRQGGVVYSLVFLDPPYQKGLALRALTKLVEGGHLARHAIVVCETALGESMPDQVGDLVRNKSTKYGNTQIHIYRTRPREENVESKETVEP